MPIEINGLPITVLKNPKDGPQVDTGRNKPAPAQEETGKPASSDTVTLTDTAARLRALGNTLSALPVTDTQRVEGVKKAIEDGDYTVDAGRVAQKMIEFEKLLKS
ncbi:MAG: flagellar biosynthesis anti-sigma factor FlgM [Gammaproteobacteria bacterium]|nr:flagellar biosynthesis anti-sigma factor FlgM [Gammaproteobacteria bacterium]